MAMVTRGMLAIAVALLPTGLVLADDDSPRSLDQPRISKEEIPEAKENPDPRVEETVTVNTEKLHGFSRQDVERATAERLAMLAGAAEPTGMSHPAEDGFTQYRIGAGDVLEFVSFDDETLNREVTVRYDGHISLPRISDIEVKGLTRAEAEQALADAYGQIYREPDLSLSIVSALSKTFTVTGDVAAPGKYPYERVTSLWDAISIAGGKRVRSGDNFIGITGQITQAAIIRRVGGERQVQAYDMRGLSEPGVYEGDVPVYYGDIVYVPEGTNLVYVLGEARSAVTVELTEGMTLAQMLALSGGFNTSTARIKEIVLLREADAENTDVHLVNLKDILRGREPDIPLQPGDIVYLPRKRLVQVQEFVERFAGSISPLLDLYTGAIDAGYALQFNRERLDALEDANSDVAVRGNVIGSGLSGIPRTLSTVPRR